MTIPFVHLHCHSHYSFFNGTASPGDLVKKAGELNMSALALTDYCNLHGAREFWLAAGNYEVKPIFGCEIRVVSKNVIDENDSVDHLTLLVMNTEGWRNLMWLSTRSFIKGSHDEPVVDKEMLQKYSAGLICLSGFASGELARLLAEGKSGYAPAKSTTAWFLDLFGDRFYLELRNHGIKKQKTLFNQTVRIGKELDVPTVATNDIHYIDKADWKIHDMLLCLKSDRSVFDKEKPRMESKRHYFRTREEMIAAFPDNRDAVERTHEIAERIDPDIFSEFYFKKHCPSLPVPKKKTADEHFRELCLAGLKKRYGNSPYADKAKERLESELNTIREFDLADYFLIFGDIARFLDERAILHTARGSFVGSIIGYVLFLSHECPIEYGLCFERFLDRKHSTPPGIFIDIDASRYAEVATYLAEMYGKGKVAETVHIERMSPRESIRNAARALDLPIHYATDEACEFSDQSWWFLKELLNFCNGKSWCIEDKESLYKRYRSEPKFKVLLDHAKFLEGLPAGFSKGKPEYCSAPVWIVSDTPLDECLPLCRIEGQEEAVLQWEENGLNDSFLQLNLFRMRDLTLLSRIIDQIRTSKGVEIDPYRLPLDDRETFELIGRGDVSGIRQFSEEFYEDCYDMSEFLRRLKPNCFVDLVAALALWRPGPLEMGAVDQYIGTKNGTKKVEYAHPVLKEFLEETYGIIVYQEQIMRILNHIGNIPLADTFTIIKDISKKKNDEIAVARQRFLNGAAANGYEIGQTSKIFDLIEDIAGYTFNKSHAVANTRIAYMTAYLKAHCPLDFMTVFGG